MVNYQHNANLQAFNTLAIPATAHCLVSVNSIDALEQALQKKAKQYKTILVIGSGSNIVLPDTFDGLVIHMAMQGRTVEQETKDSVTLSLAAGENWHDAVMWAAKNSWYGIENLALIPGTVGAAPIQNIGAYGVELKECFLYLEAMNIETGELKKFTHKDCEFGYRESIFKQALKNQWVITRVVLKLSKLPILHLDYPPLEKALESIAQDKLTPLKIAEAIIAIRQSKLPDPSVLPNAGSFFKNPIITNEKFQTLHKDYPMIAAYPVGESHTKIAAGWLLEQDGWKGRLIGGVGMHKQQALVLTNPNQLPAKNILDFTSLIKISIFEKFSIALEIEPTIVGSYSSPIQ